MDSVANWNNPNPQAPVGLDLGRALQAVMSILMQDQQMKAMMQNGPSFDNALQNWDQMVMTAIQGGGPPQQAPTYPKSMASGDEWLNNAAQTAIRGGGVPAPPPAAPQPANTARELDALVSMMARQAGY